MVIVRSRVSCGPRQRGRRASVTGLDNNLKSQYDAVAKHQSETRGKTNSSNILPQRDNPNGQIAET